MVPDDICKEICNGCGARDGFNIPNSLLGVSVSEACNVHDFMYDEGKTSEDRKFADEMFLQNMRELVSVGDWFLIRERRLLVLVYYWAVRLFGCKAFKKGK